ncbi:isoaspartyl peptidase/L-asparaginase [Brenneria rubrifaciens]|uniref:isoaspartyl peptidase/L-asparaginase n=1 Tax=Brenneria rubrifaciens TaxID=55213 RepID=UPI0036205B19
MSCTGTGEIFMRTVAAYDVSALMGLRRTDAGTGRQSVVMEKLAQLEGRGGLIAIDRHGNITLPFNMKGCTAATAM